MENVDEFLDKFGKIGSEERLLLIRSLNLGERSEAARRVLRARSRRKELMGKGLTFEESKLIVNNEKNDY